MEINWSLISLLGIIGLRILLFWVQINIRSKSTKVETLEEKLIRIEKGNKRCFIVMGFSAFGVMFSLKLAEQDSRAIILLIFFVVVIIAVDMYATKLRNEILEHKN